MFPKLCLFGVAAASLFAAEVKQSVIPKNTAIYRMQSESLGEERAVSVILPVDYEASTSRYPVLYLLHGLGDDNTAWSYMTNLSGYAARRHVIIVMPDAGRSFYVNSAADAKARFEDFVAKDLVAWTDMRFRTIPLPRARAVAGLSMGGYGAAFLGLKHYRKFGAGMGLFSGALGIAHDPPRENPNATEQARRATQQMQALFGQPGSGERRERDPFELVEKVPPAEMPLIYIACGGQDFLLAQNRAFVDLLSKKKIAYEYHEISPRVHAWDFWDEQIALFLDVLDRRAGFANGGER